jgi:hypothetical protein
MERIFGVSYPTIKSRLNRITQMLDFVETDPAPSRADIIDRLRRGEITAQQALSGSHVMPQLLTVRVKTPTRTSGPPTAQASTVVNESPQHRVSTVTVPCQDRGRTWLQ